MRIGRVIGTVTLSSYHPSFTGAVLRLTVPLSLANLTGRSDKEADPLVVYDELGAGIGSVIAFSEGAEATQPFKPDRKPVDAYNAALLDTIDIET